MTPEGLLLIDKPKGPTSHDVIARLRRLTGIRRVGHAGTLDPLATGLLLVAIGRATRLLEYVLDRPKRYEAVVRLGQRTDTYDADGVVTDEKPVNVTAVEIEQALERFRGPILQFVPLYSAVKQAGIPLYKLARQGVDVERPLREVTINDLEILSWEKPYLRLAISCSSGTYVRSIADDLGQALGCGGHIAALKRHAIGAFTIAQAASLGALDSENWIDFLLPAGAAVGHLPEATFSTEDAQRPLSGQPVPRGGAKGVGLPVRAYDANGRFLGIVVAVEQFWQPRKMFPPV